MQLSKNRRCEKHSKLAVACTKKSSTLWHDLLFVKVLVLHVATLILGLALTELTATACDCIFYDFCVDL